MMPRRRPAPAAGRIAPRCLFGLETEYALSPLSRDVLRGLVDVAHSTLEQLPSHRSSAAGGFLRNGGHWYIDSGQHPEYATPELVDPWQAVQHLGAGDRIMAAVTDQVRTRIKAPVTLRKGNLDYLARTTWGSHESYLLRARPTEAFRRRLVSHLVTRIIYCGAGGFCPLASGLAFSLAPRLAAFFSNVAAADSMRSRGLMHSRDESLAGAGYFRLHLLCGESLCSEVASWLRVGTTALVVAMAAEGHGPRGGIALSSPIDALQAIAADPTCTSRVRLADGQRASAIQIQRAYLEQAEALASASYMPPWTAAVCKEWRRTLDRLEATPRALEQRLDWTIKLALFEAHARRRGARWRAAPRAREVSTASQDATAAGSADPGDHPDRADEQLAAASDLRRLRHELFEIDTKFAQLSPPGLFQTLDRAGVLSHHVAGCDSTDAMRWGPSETRAGVRGGLVARLAGAPGRYYASWEGVWDRVACRVIDLSNPFETVALWRAQREGSRKSAEVGAGDRPR